MGTPTRSATHVVTLVVCLSSFILVPGRGLAADSDTEAPGNPAAQEDQSSESSKTSDQLETVVVTGSRLPKGGTGQDVHVYEQQRIEESGQSTVTDFLDTLPEVSLNSVESTYLATTVRLRGAVLGSALVLINGRRTQDVTGGAATNGFFDLNTIPLAMVERIEVLPTGSSAIYGGDALAGVVNIVLKSNFTGLEADAGYRFANDTDEKIFSGGAGWNSGPFNVSVVGSYNSSSTLLGRDRAITANPDYRRFGGPNLGNPFFGAPANVFSVDGSDLPGVGASYAAVPVGFTGTPSQEEFTATAGTLNTGSYTSYQSAIPASERYGIFASADYRFDFGVDLFAELLWSKYKLNIAFTPPFLLNAIVPASNAFNPFGTDVKVAGVVQGAEKFSRLTFDEDFLRPLIGARGDLGTWHWEMTALNSRDNGSQSLYGQPNATLLNAALASPDPSTALNPFIDGPMASPDLLASIYSNTLFTKFKSDADILNGFVRGNLIDLPAGSLDAVFGGEYEHNSLERNFEASREAKAAFAELRAPFFEAIDDQGGQRELLTVQVAARYDGYSDFGSKITWQAGFEFRPTESVLLRGTHATSFRPPTLYNLWAPPITGTISVTDPEKNGETVIVQVSTGGNSDLNPTTGTSTTMGIAWSPHEIPGLDASLTWWSLHIENAINRPNPQYIVDNESLYPGRVVRDSDGNIISVDYSYVNFGATRETGIDANIDWTFGTTLGDFTPAIAATYMTEFEGASTPGAQAVSRLSRANNDGVFAPRWKGTASIGWAPNQPFKLWFAGRYIGRYVDYTPPRTIGNTWYFDASLEIDLKRALDIERTPLSGIKLLVSGTNLFDTLPPYSTYFRGYDPYNYDLVGRTIFVRLQLQD